ncbi:MAG: ABC transporter ATP-binding protein [Tissierellia bacterium]|nr:ABC transporter ATP-binding protein [Tissierellia bacterium]
MITFDHVSKSFGDQEVVKDISFTIESGELFVLIGLSGCGKTTTLRMMNRLEDLSSGRILVDEKDIKNEDVIRLRRNMGYVIQQTGLFPHKTVEENIGMIPELEGMEKAKRQEIAKKWMEMVGLSYEDYKDRYPSELSGGQSQRVGVARALATDPDIILMDEPFSALDPITRGDLQDELVELHNRTKKTIVFVTHDMDEAVKIGDKICIMDEGKILQLDSPEEILKNPVNEFVSEFVGERRIWSNPDYIKVSDLMITNVIASYPEFTVFQGLNKMRQNHVDTLMIVERGSRKFKGVVTLRDALTEKNRKRPLGEMAEEPYTSLKRDDTLPHVMEIFRDQDLSYAPVLDENRCLLGLLTRSKLVYELSNQYKEEN